MNNSPIGVFDSGLGGLTVWSELYRSLPNESLIYYGDGKNCPYGNRSREEIIPFVDFAIHRLIDQGVKMIVVACNAATALTIDYLRSSYDIPFIGLEPAVKPAAAATKSKVIGILATAATLNGRHFQQTSQKYADKVKILSAVGQGFVEIVEENREQSPEAYDVVSNILSPILEQGADQIVLGCTHYPFLSDVMNRIIDGRNVRLINPAAAIERRVETLLVEHDIVSSSTNIAQYTFITSADESYRNRLIEKSKAALTLSVASKI